MRFFYLFIGVVAWAAVAVLPGRALAQTLDATYQPVLKTAAANGQLVRVVVTQPDGKVLVGGGFDFLNGTVNSRLQRFNTNGTLDATFNPGGTGPNELVDNIVLQPDGKILIAGQFSTYNQTAIGGVARLLPNGTLDATFNPGGIGSLDQLLGLAVQADGKILVGGYGLNTYNGQQVNGLIRLNLNGSLDAAFNATVGPSFGGVMSIVIQPDGKILVGGSSNPGSSPSLIRLNPDGTTDASWNIGTGPRLTVTQYSSPTVRSLYLQADGKLLVGGLFNDFNGQPVNNLVRLLPSGALDTSFAPPIGPNNTVYNIYPQAGGGYLLTGLFTQYGGVARGGIAGISASGVLLPTFAGGTGANLPVYSLAALPNGQLLAGGFFTTYDGVAATGLAPLTATGAYNPALAPAFSPLLELRGRVSKLVPLPAGGALVSGDFTNVNGTTVGTTQAVHTVRLTASGGLDASYQAVPSITGGYVFPQANGQVYVCPGPTNVSSQRLTRYDASGQLDAGFAPALFNGIISGVLAEAGGSALVYGSYTTLNGQTRRNLVRLLANGTVDPAFAPPANALSGEVSEVSVQPGGKLLVHSGVISSNLIRLDAATGQVDASFALPPALAPSTTFRLLMQPDGRSLVFGAFTTFAGVATPGGVARLLVNGGLDNSFVGPSAFAWPTLVQSDGRILAYGSSQDGATLQRLLPDGTRDNSFSTLIFPETRRYFVDEPLNGVAQQPTDGRLLLFGSFCYVLGQPRVALARLGGTGTGTRAGQGRLDISVFPNPSAGRFQVEGPGLADARYLQVMNELGQEVLRRPLPAADHSVDLSGQAPGLYLLRIGSATTRATLPLVLSR
ncbi:MAG: hypothetical protein JWP58_425 [Hymenobacter sp.]|nr:hypothetical protein [Hymenobacter sp.]